MVQQPDSRDNDTVLELIEHFAGDGCCPLCGQTYRRDDIQVVREQWRAARWILSMTCHCCGTASLIKARMPQQFYVQQHPHIELTSCEQRRFAGAARLTIDDVLDMHLYLKEFQGDVRRLGANPALQ